MFNNSCADSSNARVLVWAEMGKHLVEKNGHGAVSRGSGRRETARRSALDTLKGGKNRDFPMTPALAEQLSVNRP